MNIVCTPFGKTADGRPVDRYTLTDGRCSASILTLGGIIQSLIVPDRNGRPTDIVLGFDTVAAYESQTCYIGALLGRCANRIAGGRVALGGREIRLACNDHGACHLHGGETGFDKRIWSASVANGGLTLRYDSPAGEEHYPGNLRASVTYRLEDGALSLEYRAETDADTLCNLSNHAYFNLGGHASGEVGEQTVCIPADHFTPIGKNSAPTGEVASVEGTPLDLRRFTPLGAHWDDKFPQLRRAGGYDHNYIIGGDGLRPFALAECAQTGITLSVESDMPGMQLYSGNYLDANLPRGKGGVQYGRRHGFCLETQFWPNAPAFPHFPQPVLRAGESCRHFTNFHFSLHP